MTDTWSSQAHGPWSASRYGEVLYVSGEIDVSDGIAVGERIAREVADGVAVLDLTGVTFCGAQGVHAVMQGHAARGGHTALQVRCEGFVFDVLQICGLDRVEGLILVDVGGTRIPQPIGDL